MTDEQQNEMRSLIESFRDAALEEIESAKQCRGGMVTHEEIDAFVKYDTWLKLDDAARKTAAKKSGPQLC